MGGVLVGRNEMQMILSPWVWPTYPFYQLRRKDLTFGESARSATGFALLFARDILLMRPVVYLASLNDVSPNGSRPSWDAVLKKYDFVQYKTFRELTEKWVTG